MTRRHHVALSFLVGAGFLFGWTASVTSHHVHYGDASTLVATGLLFFMIGFVLSGR